MDIVYCIYNISFSHLTVEGHLLFLTSTIMNNAAVNIHYKSLSGHVFSFPWVHVQE
jgi:hypothetical protein